MAAIDSWGRRRISSALGAFARSNGTIAAALATSSARSVAWPTLPPSVRSSISGPPCYSFNRCKIFENVKIVEYPSSSPENAVVSSRTEIAMTAITVVRFPERRGVAHLHVRKATHGLLDDGRCQANLIKPLDLESRGIVTVVDLDEVLHA